MPSARSISSRAMPSVLFSRESSWSSRALSSLWPSLVVGGTRRSSSVLPKGRLEQRHTAVRQERGSGHSAFGLIGHEIGKASVFYCVCKAALDFFFHWRHCILVCHATLKIFDISQPSILLPYPATNTRTRTRTHTYIHIHTHTHSTLWSRYTDLLPPSMPITGSGQDGDWLG